MTEKELSRSIISVAREAGWLVARTWLSKFSPAGEPDLRMVRPPRLICAELKGPKAKLSAPQAEWLQQLAQVPGVEVYVVREADLEWFYRNLVSQECHIHEDVMQVMLHNALVRDGHA